MAKGLNDKQSIDTERDLRDDGVSTLQGISWLTTAPLIGKGMFELIQPGEGGFGVNLTRVLATLAVVAGGYYVTRMAIAKGAPLAATGDKVALAASLVTFGVLTPTIVTVSYLALSAPDIAKMDSRQLCTAIRSTSGAIDQAVLARLGLERSANSISNEAAGKSVAEAKEGRESGRKSQIGRPQPITNLYADASRRTGKLAEDIKAAESSRTTKLRDLAALAEDCDRTISDARKWRKDGRSTVYVLYDKATGVTRELLQTAPVGGAKDVVDELRGLAKSTTGDSPELLAARRTVGGWADNLDRQIAALPRLPEPLPAASPATELVSAFEPERFASLWPNFCIALLTEGGSFLSWIFAYVLARRRQQVRGGVSPDDNDTAAPRMNGRSA